MQSDFITPAKKIMEVIQTHDINQGSQNFK